MEFTEDEQAIADAVRQLVAAAITPSSDQNDRDQVYPRANLLALGQHGYLGMTVPPADGGGGTSYLAQTLVVEAVAYGDPATAVVYEVHNSLHLEAIHRYGTAAQKAEWLPPLIAGQQIGAFALTEPDAGSNAAALATVAEPVEGGYRLRGGKVFITGAGEADRYLVFARLPGTLGRDGITAFLVDKGAPGLSFGRAEEKMGLHAAKTGAVLLDQVMVPTSHRLGAEGAGYDMALRLLEGGRIGIAAQALGMLGRALDLSLTYARTRKQFGQAIGRFEAVQFKLADMATDLHAGRLLAYDAARVREDTQQGRMAAAMAKLFCSEAAVRHCLAAVQVHGGYGYMREYQVERLLRDAKVTEIYEGTSEIMRLVIGSQLLRGDAAPRLES
ncbi:MAG: acyl-CoA dehydrogenase family protein [Thermaerobacter sp.]|nr:acyl-CoA dehydrogenase family protein [Thermaerobacter sp.]